MNEMQETVQISEKQKQYERIFYLSRIFSGGAIASFLLMFLPVQYLVYLLLPLLFGFVITLFACPWLQNTKPDLYEAVIWRIFIISTIIGIGVSIFGLLMQ